MQKPDFPVTVPSHCQLPTCSSSYPLKATARIGAMLLSSVCKPARMTGTGASFWYSGHVAASPRPPLPPAPATTATKLWSISVSYRQLLCAPASMTGTGELFRYYILITVLSHCVPPPPHPTPGRVYRHKAMLCLGAIMSSLWEPASMTGAAALFPYSGHGIVPTFWSRYCLIALFPHCGHGIKPIFWSR